MYVASMRFWNEDVSVGETVVSWRAIVVERRATFPVWIPSYRGSVAPQAYVDVDLCLHSVYFFANAVVSAKACLLQRDRSCRRRSRPALSRLPWPNNPANSIFTYADTYALRTASIAPIRYMMSMVLMVELLHPTIFTGPSRHDHRPIQSDHIAGNAVMPRSCIVVSPRKSYRWSIDNLNIIMESEDISRQTLRTIQCWTIWYYHIICRLPLS